MESGGRSCVQGVCVVAGRRLLLAGLVLATGSSFAAEQRSAEQSSDVVNYAFASQLGSGIYSVNGRTVQIYRIPISKKVPIPGRQALGPEAHPFRSLWVSTTSPRRI